MISGMSARIGESQGKGRSIGESGMDLGRGGDSDFLQGNVEGLMWGRWDLCRTKDQLKERLRQEILRVEGERSLQDSVTPFARRRVDYPPVEYPPVYVPPNFHGAVNTEWRTSDYGTSDPQHSAQVNAGERFCASVVLCGK